MSDRRHQSPHRWCVFKRAYSWRTGTFSDHVISRHKTKGAADRARVRSPEYAVRRLSKDERA